MITQADSPRAAKATTPTLAQLTTIGVGGAVDRFVEPRSEEAFIAAVRDADMAHLPLLVIGGGSNLLVADAPFHGVVVRDARRGISVSEDKAEIRASFDGGARGDTISDTANDTKAQTDHQADTDTNAKAAADAECNAGVNMNEQADAVVIVAQAGVSWDDFVAFCVSSGFSGVEGLSGVPGTVGASVVQNIGAYGQEVASVVSSVRVFDRKRDSVCRLEREDMRFGYRSSALKSSMYVAPATPAGDYFPTPRYAVLDVTFVLRRSSTGEVAFGQLAKALGVETGKRMSIALIRNVVLKIRAAKGMLEDSGRYASPWMCGCRDERNVNEAMEATEAMNASHGNDIPGQQEFDQAHGVQRDSADGGVQRQPDFNRHSCGSFFMNPILEPAQAVHLPADAPRFDAILPDGQPGVKTSAAWLIDHAGFHKGFKVRHDACAGLSTLHTLALTNRGGASAEDIAELARTIQDGVEAAYGIRLVPEPVVVGMDLR